MFVVFFISTLLEERERIDEIMMECILSRFKEKNGGESKMAYKNKLFV
jgi:hypothetical protein